MSFRRQFARWIALLVLLNIGAGFCNCLRENMIPGSSATPGLTNHGNRDAAPDCGDNCESCICHATLLMVRTESFKVTLGISWLPALLLSSFSDPDRNSLTEPPRA